MPGPDPLFEPYALGPLTLPNRVLMSPMTRCRASQPELAAHALNATYYAQRASAGLIISEATQVCPEGYGYCGTPGIYSDAQRDGWREVTQAVHAAGGLIVAQLWHVGRISHPDLQPEGKLPVAPSAIAPQGEEAYTCSGKKPIPVPHALTADEIAEVVERYRHGATVAKEAGFDGVELHAANGYLIDAFLRTGTNHRDDAFGGSIEGRMKFPLQVVDALVEVWGADRVGVRISPTGSFNDMQDDDPLTHFTTFAKALDERGLAFLEVVGQLFDQSEPHPQQEAIDRSLRKAFSRTVIVNGGYDAAKAREAISSGQADLVTFGRPFIGNADLPDRLRLGTQLVEAPMDTWYYAGEGDMARGYTDW